MSLERYVARRLRAKRRELKIPQADIAAALGVGRQTYTKIETGRMILHLDTLYAIARYMNVYYLDLIAGYAADAESKSTVGTVRKLDLTQPDNMLS